MLYEVITDSVPLPWEGGPTMEEREYRVFLLTAFYLAVVCVLCQWARSLESRREISSLRSRILDVVEGEGDLTRRLSLRVITSYSIHYTKLYDQ